LISLQEAKISSEKSNHNLLEQIRGLEEKSAQREVMVSNKDQQLQENIQNYEALQKQYQALLDVMKSLEKSEKVE
jgi:hypothetical protein